MFCHFLEEVPVLITQVVEAQLAVVVHQHTPHCRETGISGIHKYHTQCNNLQENNWWRGVSCDTYNVLLIFLKFKIMFPEKLLPESLQNFLGGLF